MRRRGVGPQAVDAESQAVVARRVHRVKLRDPPVVAVDEAPAHVDLGGVAARALAGLPHAAVEVRLLNVAGPLAELRIPLEQARILARADELLDGQARAAGVHGRDGRLPGVAGRVGVIGAVGDPVGAPHLRRPLAEQVTHLEPGHRVRRHVLNTARSRRGPGSSRASPGPRGCRPSRSGRQRRA